MLWHKPTVEVLQRISEQEPFMICTTSTVSGEPGGTVGARHPRIALAITFCKIPCFRLAASNKMEAVKLEPGILASNDTTNTTAILAAKDLLIVIGSD